MELKIASTVSVNYEVTGSGEQDFLLFNGATLPLEFWGPLAERLGTLGRVIRFDQRNAGRTEFDGDFTLGDVAADAAALLQELNVDQVVVIGHAWGGRAAQVFARDFPAFVSRLVIIGTGGQFPPVDMSATGEAMQAARRNGDRAAWEPTFEKMWFGEGFASRDPDTFAEVCDLMWGYRPPRTARWNMKAYPSAGYWGTAAVPTLLVYGQEDKNGTPENAADLDRRLSDSRLVMIEGAGHFVIREAADRVFDEIRDFVSR